MQPCNQCHACSFPDKVAEAKATIPTSWREELVEGEAPDGVWIAAFMRSVLEDFQSAAQTSGLGGNVRLTIAPGASSLDAVREVTRVMMAYHRGECPPFEEDFS